jgi:hypothetical protein
VENKPILAFLVLKYFYGIFRPENFIIGLPYTGIHLPDFSRGKMISTVTTSTVSTITSAALFGTLAVVGVLILVTLLIQKEMISGSQDVRILRLHRALNIAIVPLLVVFVLLVVTRVTEVLQ